MNTFKGYCYATIQEAANAELSESSLIGSNGLAAPSSFTVTSASTVDLSFNYQPFAGFPSTVVLSRSYPVCDSVGYLTNYSGISLDDAVLTSWAVVAVWVTAWGIKVIRRAL